MGLNSMNTKNGLQVEKQEVHNIDTLLLDIFLFSENGLQINEYDERLDKYPYIKKYKKVIEGSLKTMEIVKEQIKDKQDLSPEDKKVIEDIYDKLIRQKFYASFVKKYLEILVNNYCKEGKDVYKCLEKYFSEQIVYVGFLTYGFVKDNYKNGEINFVNIFERLYDLGYRARKDIEFYKNYGFIPEEQEIELKEDIENILDEIKKELGDDKEKLDNIIKFISSTEESNIYDKNEDENKNEDINESRNENLNLSTVISKILNIINKNLSFKSNKGKLQNDIENDIDDIENDIRKINDIRRKIVSVENTINKYNSLDDLIETYIKLYKKYHLYKILIDSLIKNYGELELHTLNIDPLILGNEIGEQLSNLSSSKFMLKISSILIKIQEEYQVTKQLYEQLEKVKDSQINYLDIKKEILEKQRNIVELVKKYNSIQIKVNQIEREINDTGNVLRDNIQIYLDYLKGLYHPREINNIINNIKVHLTNILDINFKNYEAYQNEKKRRELLNNIINGLNNYSIDFYIDILKYIKEYGEDKEISTILKYIDEDIILTNYISSLLQKFDEIEDNLIKHIETIKKLKDIYPSIPNKYESIENIINALYKFFTDGEVGLLDKSEKSIVDSLVYKIDNIIYNILLGNIEFFKYLKKIESLPYLTKNYANLFKLLEIIIEKGYNILDVILLGENLTTKKEKEMYIKFINNNKGNIKKFIIQLAEAYVYTQDSIKKELYKSKLEKVADFVELDFNTKQIIKYPELFLNVYKGKIKIGDIEKDIYNLFYEEKIQGEQLEDLIDFLKEGEYDVRLYEVLHRIIKLYYTEFNKEKERIKEALGILRGVSIEKISNHKWLKLIEEKVSKMINLSMYNFFEFLNGKKEEGCDNIDIYLEVYEYYKYLHDIIEVINGLGIDTQQILHEFINGLGDYYELGDKYLDINELKEFLESFIEIKIEYEEPKYCDRLRFDKKFLPWIEENKKRLLRLGIKKVRVSNLFGWEPLEINIDSQKGEVEDLNEMVELIEKLQEIKKRHGIKVYIDFYCSNFFENSEYKKNVKAIAGWITKNIEKFSENNVKEVRISNHWDIYEYNNKKKLNIDASLDSPEVSELDENRNRIFLPNETKKLRKLLKELKFDLIGF